MENSSNIQDGDVVAVRTWRYRGSNSTYGKKTEYKFPLKKSPASEYYTKEYAVGEAEAVEAGSKRLRSSFKAPLYSGAASNDNNLITVELGHEVGRHQNQDHEQIEYNYYSTITLGQQLTKPGIDTREHRVYKFLG